MSEKVEIENSVKIDELRNLLKQNCLFEFDDGSIDAFQVKTFLIYNTFVVNNFPA